MKIKKRVAGLLAFAMLLGSTNILGNSQDRLPQDGIAPIVVSHVLNTGTGDIVPSAQITFKRATNSGTSSKPGETNQPEAEYYSFILDDIFGKQIVSDRFQATKDKETYVENIEDHLNNVNEFKNGNLYKVTVRPGHLHLDDEGREYEAPLSNTSTDPAKYFLTDLNTIMREKNDQIEVVWEYIPGATYKLVYIDKDTNTKAGVDGTDGSEQTGVGTQVVVLSEDDLELITEGGVKKVKYIIPNTVAGQKYSGYVLVNSISNSFLKDRWENVGKNTENPKIAQASRSVGLQITNIGRNRIELKWQLGAWADNNTLKVTKIYRKTEGETAYTLIGTLNNASLNPRDPGKFEHDEPTKKSKYYVEFIFTGPNGDESLFTTEEEYVPYELREQPLKPQVPTPYSDSVKDKEGFEKKDYLVTGDDVSVDKMKPNTFYMKSKNPLQIQLVWDAPKKSDGKIEYEMKYDIWVAEDEDMLNDEEVEPIIKDLSIDSNMQDDLIYKQDNKTVIGFKTLLSEYITSQGDIKSLVSNQTYYIKIVAKRDYSGTYSISQPTIVAITVDKNGDIFTPPVLAKPPLRIQENGIAVDSIKIEWLEKWYEITANNPNNYTDEDERFFARLWNSRVFTGGAPAIKFQGEEDKELKEHILMTKKDVEAVKTIVGNSYSNDYRDREVSLGEDIKYEVKTLLYDDVLKQIKDKNADVSTPSSITFEKWIVDNESDTVDGWRTITPGSVNHGDNLPWKDFKVEGLEPNTRYVILVRAYRVLETGQKLTQTFPSYVIGTTLSEYESPEAIPTVPTLNPNGVTDASVSVWWTYNEDFDYEIVYSRLEDPSKAKTWEFKISNEPGDKDYVANGGKAIVTITDLMPDTTYNVWIRAKQKKGSEISSWSNPVTQTTNTIENPDPPRGLGPAAYQSILEIGQDFKPVTNEYITVEWLKDVEDNEETEAANKVYSYVLEFADNPEFLDALTVTTGGKGDNPDKVEILDKTMVKFLELEANRPYYVRAKTVLTFTDPETKREIVRESEFTKSVRILTKTSDDEYDGGENDNVVIYPEPVEETYKDDIWTWEIVDSAKIITQIQAKKDYYYTINVELYKNKYDAKVRRIKMAKSVLDTLANQGMELRIQTNIGVYEIPAKSLSYYSNMHSASDKVQFDLTTAKSSDIYAYQRSYPEMLVKGERLQITFRGENRTTEVKKLDGYARVKLKLDALGSYNYKDLYTYTYLYDQASWTKENYTVETLTNSYLTYRTAQLGLYAVYEKAITSTNNITYLMSRLSNTYNIEGLGSVYYSKDYVYRDQYVILLMGIAQNQTSINLTQKASSDLLNKAKTAGIYVSSNSGTITEEQAIAGIVKLYEIKNGYKIKPSSMSFSNVSANYREAVRKAYAIGLITDINPQAKVTYGTLCDWVAQVVE